MPRIVAYCGSNEGKKKNRQRGKALCVRMLLYFSKRGAKFPSRKKAVRTVCGQFCGQSRERGYIFWCNPLISLEPARGFEPWTYWLRISRSTNWAKAAYSWNYLNFCVLFGWIRFLRNIWSHTRTTAWVALLGASYIAESFGVYWSLFVYPEQQVPTA